MPTKCFGCGEDCACDTAFVYRNLDGRSVFTGIVRKPTPGGEAGLFKLHDPFGDANDNCVKLDPQSFMIDMSVYDNCSFASAPFRTDDLVKMRLCECTDPETCRRKWLPSEYDEDFPFGIDDEGRWRVNVRLGDRVMLVTNVPHPKYGGPIQERFWAEVLAVHTLGLNELEPLLTVVPIVDKWRFIKAKRWSPKVSLVCAVSCVAAVEHGENWA